MIRLFLFFSLVYSCVSFGSDNASGFSFSEIDIEALSEGEQELLEDLGIIYLEKLVSSKPLAIGFERINGYTAVRKNSLGVCVYSLHIFNNENLLKSKTWSKRYISSVGFDCEKRVDSRFAEVESVSDRTAALVLSSFEKNKTDIEKFVSFSGVADSRRYTILDRLKNSHIESIGYKYIEELDIGCLTIGFINYIDDSRLVLLGSFEFESSMLEIILVGVPIS